MVILSPNIMERSIMKYMNICYRPEHRIRPSNEIVLRYEGSPITECEEEARVIFDRICRLIDTADVWKTYSNKDDNKNIVLASIKKEIYSMIPEAENEIHMLIRKYEIEDGIEKEELLDVVTQLYERAEASLS